MLSCFFLLLNYPAHERRAAGFPKARNKVFQKLFFHLDFLYQ